MSPVACSGDRIGQGRAKGKGWAAQGWLLGSAGLGSRRAAARRAGGQERQEGGGRGGEERREAAGQGGNKTKIPQPKPSPTLQIKLTVFGPSGPNRQAFPRFQFLSRAPDCCGRAHAHAHSHILCTQQAGPGTWTDCHTGLQASSSPSIPHNSMPSIDTTTENRPDHPDPRRGPSFEAHSSPPSISHPIP